MLVTFLVPDLASNILGATRRLAACIPPPHEVQIAGVAQWGTINRMYDDGFPYVRVSAPRAYRIPYFFRAVRDLADAATGDIIVAMKACAPSLPAALLAKRRRGAKVIAYLDEWDAANAASWSFFRRFRYFLRDWAHPADDLYAPHWERRLRECDAIIGTTTFLQRRFHATRIHLGADTTFFAPPPPAETEALRARLGLLDARPLLIFGGVLRPHKGIAPFLEAIRRLQPTHHPHLLIAGPRTDAVEALLSNPGTAPFVHCTGPIPHAEMPLHLSLADALLVPLSNNLLAQSQMPCKVFEAMAMQKPILASAVSDLPEVLSGCGYLCPPEDPDATTAALADLLDHPDTASSRALLARQKACSTYSFDATRSQFLATLGLN